MPLAFVEFHAQVRLLEARVRIAEASAALAAYRVLVRMLEREFGAKRVLLTTNCTHALEMAALLLEVGPGVFSVVPGDHVVFGFVPACGRCPTGRAWNRSRRASPATRDPAASGARPGSG